MIVSNTKVDTKCNKAEECKQYTKNQLVTIFYVKSTQFFTFSEKCKQLFTVSDVYKLNCKHPKTKIGFGAYLIAYFGF